MDLQKAIDAPRFHFQAVPDSISIEPNALSPDVIQSLEKWGYQVTPEKTWASIAAVLVNRDGQLIGAIDTRRPDGAALGY